MPPILYYCYDAYCGWCYGNSNTILQVQQHYGTTLHYEVLSGGMVLPATPTPISATAGYIQEAYKIVEKETGVIFGADYLWHINHPHLSDWYPNSELPAIALCVLKQLQPTQQVQLAIAIQKALYAEGRDLTDTEAYNEILVQFGINKTTFSEAIKEEKYKAKAHQEFALCKQLQVKGYPTTYVQLADNKLQLVASGYTTFEKIRKRIDIAIAIN